MGEIYTVLIDGFDFEVDLPAERLSLVQIPSTHFGLSSSQLSNYTFQAALNNMFAGNIFGGTFNINVNPVNATNTGVH